LRTGIKPTAAIPIMPERCLVASLSYAGGRSWLFRALGSRLHAARLPPRSRALKDDSKGDFSRANTLQFRKRRAKRCSRTFYLTRSSGFTTLRWLTCWHTRDVASARNSAALVQ
jgi:hypothetical protein